MIPLSTRMRPETIDEFVGQRHFMYKGSLLYNAIKNKTFDSAIFYGPRNGAKQPLPDSSQEKWMRISMN